MAFYHMNDYEMKLLFETKQAEMSAVRNKSKQLKKQQPKKSGVQPKGNRLI